MSATGTSLVPWLAAPLALGVVAVVVVLTRSHSPGPAAAPMAAHQAPTPALAAHQTPTPTPGLAVPVATPSQNEAANVRTTITLDPSAIETTTPSALRGKHTASSSASKLSASKPGIARLEGSHEPAVNLESSGSGPSAGPSKAAGNGDLFEGARPARGAQAVASNEAPQPEARKQEQAAAQPPAKPAVLDDARLEREMQMLSVAQHSLASDPQRALSLARQGEAEFKGSMFTEERQQVLLLALVQLGRLDEAKKLARPYLARYPHGPFSDRVRRALATGRVEH
jgi:hypothetical protein